MSTLTPVIAVMAIGLVIFYIAPAFAPTGKPFAISVTVAAVCLLLFWLSAFLGPWKMEYPRGLGASIDIFFRLAATAYLLAALLLRRLNSFAAERGWVAYRHWVPVLVVSVVIPIPLTMLI